MIVIIKLKHIFGIINFSRHNGIGYILIVAKYILMLVENNIETEKYILEIIGFVNCYYIPCSRKLIAFNLTKVNKKNCDAPIKTLAEDRYYRAHK